MRKTANQELGRRYKLVDYFRSRLKTIRINPKEFFFCDLITTQQTSTLSEMTTKAFANTLHEMTGGTGGIPVWGVTEGYPRLAHCQVCVEARVVFAYMDSRTNPFQLTLTFLGGLWVGALPRLPPPLTPGLDRGNSFPAFDPLRHPPSPLFFSSCGLGPCKPRAAGWSISTLF